MKGRDLYPGTPEIADKPFWSCDSCYAWVGCHEGTTDPLGTPAGPATRQARRRLAQIIEPLWRGAATSGEYSSSMPASARDAAVKKARARVYEYLADGMRIDRVDCAVARFDEAQCERAMKVLAGVTYGQIREWAQKREGKA